MTKGNITRRLNGEGLLAILPNPFTRVDLTPLGVTRPTQPAGQPSGGTNRPPQQK